MPVRNLTATAIAELDAILDGSHAFGPEAAETTLQRFTTVFAEISSGHGLGHRRSDLGFPEYIRLRRLRPLPFTVIYDERTRIVLRIIRGSRIHGGTVLDDFGRA